MKWFRDILDKWGLEYFNRYYGIYRGFVSSNQDPDNRGRLQLTVPKVYGDQTYKRWADPKGMYAGKGIGSFWIPNKGDPVWVQFEDGDPRFPVWDYGWWRKGDAPEGAKPENKIIQTTSGHRIEMDDENELIRIRDAHGSVVIMNSDGLFHGVSEDGKEPAVLGDTIMKLLNEFRDDIGNLGTITTSTGVTAQIKTSPQWAVLVQKWDKKWKQFKTLR